MLNKVLIPLLGLLLHSSASASLIYRVTPLGDLGGGSSYGTAINDNGDAVGYSEVDGGGTRAFLWTQDGGIQNLGNVGGGQSLARDINNAGHVVGESSTQAFRWTSGSGMVLIDSSGNSGSANDLNEASQIVGTRNLGGADRTIRWNADNADVNVFSTSNTRGVANNDNNEFVGTHNFGEGGYFADSFPLRSNLGTFIPTDLNNDRLIVGSVGDMAALRDFDTSMTTLLGKLSLTDSLSRAEGINELGTIVGVSEGTGAFLWSSSMGLQDLSSMLRSQDAGWQILSATDINNVGQIIGVGRFNGIDQAIILNSVPEPGLLAMSGGLLWWCVVLVRRLRGATGSASTIG